jgi:hypothetical protein
MLPSRPIIVLQVVLAAALLAVAFFALDASKPAQAGNALITVDAETAFSGNDINLDLDGLDDDGYCSLREAMKIVRENITDPNGDCDGAVGGNGDDEITFEEAATAGSTLVFRLKPGSGVDIGDLNTGSGGPLFIHKPPNSFIDFDGNLATRVLTVETGTAATLTGINIRGGKSNDPGGCNGINNQATLTLDHVIMLNNRSEGVMNATAALCGQAGATTNVKYSAIYNNFPDSGPGVNGPIAFFGGTANIDHTSISENGPANISGIFAQGGATVNITNSTINYTDGPTAGALLDAQNNSTINLLNVTLEQVSDGPQILVNLATINAKNTIFDSNAGCGTALSDDQGGNVASSGDCGLNDPSSTSNATLNLGGPLTVNGTTVYVPLAGSDAIDGGINTGCPDDDQRGIASTRPKDGDDDNVAICDAGAYESDEDTTTASPTPLLTATPTPTPTPTASPSGSATPTATATATATPTGTPSSGTPTAEPTATLIPDLRQGDFDCSGTVDDVDFLGGLAYAAGFGQIEDKPAGCPDLDETYPATGFAWGDINCDGNVDSLDDLYIIAAIAAYTGLPLPSNCFPVGALLT